MPDTETITAPASLATFQPAIARHAARPHDAAPWPEALDAVLSPALLAEARAEIATWPGYAPTPVHALERLAAHLGVGAVHYKDEGKRFALGSFKALGGAYAVLKLAARHLGQGGADAPTLADIRAGTYQDQLADLTVCTATDGNHGRSVAWGARMAGCACCIYIHAGVSEGRKAAMEALGATVVRIDGDYDASVRQCGADADANGWFVVSDTSYPGYMDLPRFVMAGYGVMAAEALDQLDIPPTHIFIQAGVGGVAAAVAATFWQALGKGRPRIVIVEPTRAACLMATHDADTPTAVELREETVMAGLSCGEVSLLAWDVLSQCADHFLTIDDDAVAPAMRLLASGAAGDGRVVAGESAVPGLIGLAGAALNDDLRAAMDMNDTSRVLLLGCEGATDADIYRDMVGLTPDEVTG